MTINVANDSNIAEESAASVDNIRQPGLFSSVVQLIESLMSEEHRPLVSFNLLYLKAGNSGHARCSTSGNRIYRVMWTSSTVKNEHESLVHLAQFTASTTHLTERMRHACSEGPSNSGYESALLDEEGREISVVAEFLGYLRARGCSTKTIAAHAHDLVLRYNPPQ